MLVIVGGKIHLIQKDSTENYTQHIERSWYQINNNTSYTESKMWQGAKYYKCIYSSVTPVSSAGGFTASGM
jgi:hypothetical protein